MITRFVILIPALALAVLVACSESPEPQPAPTARSTATPTAVPTPVPTPTPIVPFENSLTGADLSKFLGLPTEFQDALVAESKKTGNDRALQYLHDLPDDAVPVADLFSMFRVQNPNNFRAQRLRDTYNWLGSAEQRRLLLEAYPNAGYWYLEEEWREGYLTDLEYHFGQFGHMVDAVYQIMSDGELLPPPAETLSPSAQDKLDSLNPLLNESFRLMWGNTRLHDMIDPATKLGNWLLNMPLEMPGVNSLGLPSQIVTVLEREPELWKLAQKIIAADLVRTQEWSAGDATTLQQLVATYRAPGGKADFERGLIPNGTGIMKLMSCTYKAERGIVSPEWAIPKPLRDIHPSELMFALPSPEDSLSEPALAKLRLMDTEMREALDFSWYSTVQLPKEAAYLACFIAEWDRGIIDAPFTAIPAPANLLSAENLELYEKFSDRSKSGFKRELANLILKGEVRVRRPLELEQRVSSFDSTPDEFLKGLRIWSYRSVTERACNTEQLGCGGS